MNSQKCCHNKDSFLILNFINLYSKYFSKGTLSLIDFVTYEIES